MSLGRRQEWFPVSYDKDFYNMSVSGSLYSLVAVVPPEKADCSKEENILGLLLRKKAFEKCLEVDALSW